MQDLSQLIQDFLAPQERFETIRREALSRARRGLCDLGYANPWDGPSPEVVEVIGDSLKGARPLDLQYTPYGGATITRRIVAQSLGSDYHWKDVVLTPGAMAALNLAFRCLKDEDPQAEVIVITPCWLDTPLYLANLGIKPVMVPLDKDSLRLDVDAIAAAITPHTRALVLSQPANPTGILYHREELNQVAQVLENAPTKPLWISDECHRDVAFGGQEFVSPRELYDRTCTVFSFGKAFALQGQRIGYLAVSPRMEERTHLAERYERLCRVMGFCTPTSLMQLALRNLIGVKLDWTLLSERREKALSVLQDAGYEVVPSQATFFLYPKSPIADEFEFCERLAARGLLTLPAGMFHHSGHFRISLTATDAMLERGLDVLKGVMEWRKSA